MKVPMDVGRQIQGYTLDHMVGDMHGLKGSKHVQFDGLRDVHVSGRFGALKTALTKLFSSPKLATIDDHLNGREPTSAYNRMTERHKAGSEALIKALERDFPKVAEQVIEKMKSKNIDMNALTVNNARYMLKLAEGLSGKY